MSLKRIGSWGAAWVLVMLSGTLALAQGMQDMQLFGHVNRDEYGGGVRSNEGVFFVFDGLYVNTQRPTTASLGATGMSGGAATRSYGEFAGDQVVEYDSLNTSQFHNSWGGAMRVEMGNICEHEGWMVGYTNAHQSVQSVNQTGVHMLFEDDPVTPAWVPSPANPALIAPLPLPFTGMGRLWGNVRIGFDPTAVDPADDTTWPVLGPLPIVWERLRMSQITSFQYVDAAYIYRAHPHWMGGVWEFSLGARWFEFQEDFNVNASGGTLGTNSQLYIDNHAWNEMVGPLLALRITHEHQGWSFSAYGSFTAAANMQTDRQTATLVTRPETGTGTSTTTTDDPPRRFTLWNAQRLQGDPAPVNTTEFTPIVEMRLEAKYQMTRAMAFKAGWNGWWMDNLARPANMVDYHVTETSFLGIKADHNRQQAFINGLVLGVEFNR